MGYWMDAYISGYKKERRRRRGGEGKRKDDEQKNISADVGL